MKSRSAHRITPWLIALIFFLPVTPSLAFAQLKVVTTTQDLASLVQDIGGDTVTVESLAQGTQDPHLLTAKPSYIFKLKNADLLVYNGMNLEAGWLPTILRGSGNLDILEGMQGHLNAATGIQPLEIPEAHGHAGADIHPAGNPHYLLDPANGNRVARLIASRLIEMIPEQEPTLKENLQRFTNHLENKILEWKQRMKPLAGFQVIGYHRTLTYFFKQFGLTYAGSLEPLPGITPTPRQLTRMVEIAKKKQARLIAQANYYESRSAKWLAEKSGLPVLLLGVSVGGTDEVNDYPGLIESLVKTFERSIKN